MRRFWKSVSLRSTPTHYEVQLDKARSLRTPSGSLLAVPLKHPLLARLIVHEWDSQQRLIKSHALPLTSLVARAIDGFAEEGERREAVEEMLKYAQTDTIW
jgi:ATP synthase F1 complex assembly factor 2